VHFSEFAYTNLSADPATDQEW